SVFLARCLAEVVERKCSSSIRPPAGTDVAHLRRASPPRRQGAPVASRCRGKMRRRLGLLLALLAILALTATPAAGGTGSRTFTFYGSGYGHGLGLSQWGAYGMAQQGKTYRQILTHFYRGTR